MFFGFYWYLGSGLKKFFEEIACQKANDKNDDY
jgi:hypothetical protein